MTVSFVLLARNSFYNSGKTFSSLLLFSVGKQLGGFIISLILHLTDELTVYENCLTGGLARELN